MKVALYFWINLLIATVISIFAAIYQVTGVNLASSMPGGYTEAVFSGQAIAGIISSVVNILSLAFTNDQKSAAVCFFVLAALITTGVMVSFHRLRNHPLFIKYQEDPYEEEDSDEFYETMSVSRFSITQSELDIAKQVADLMASQPSQAENFIDIFKMLWAEELAAFNTSFFTLSVFPGLISHVRSSHETSGAWGDKFFVPVATFLLFNICDYVGRFLTNCCVFWGSKTSKGLAICTFMRYVFWMAFPLCNINGKSAFIPTLFHEDWMYCLLVAIFGYVLYDG